VAAIVAVVVLGGLLADSVIAAPGAGTVAISGPVDMTAAPGWVLSTSAGSITGGVALQNASALLVAQVVSTAYGGDDRQLLTDSKSSLQANTAQIWFGDDRRVTRGGREASEVTFSALVSSAGSSGVVDGELVCLVLKSGGNTYAVLIQVGVPQGGLSTLIGDIDTMAASLAVAP
jgi:hypothetical protein